MNGEPMQATGPDVLCPYCDCPLAKNLDGSLWCDTCNTFWPSLADVEREFAQKKRARALAKEAANNDPSTHPEPVTPAANDGSGQSQLEEQPARDIEILKALQPSEWTDEEIEIIKNDQRQEAHIINLAGAEEACGKDKLQNIIAEIEHLNDTDYETRRTELAKRYGVRRPFLDSVRLSLKPATEKAGNGRRVNIPEDPAWPQPVDTAELICEIIEHVKQYVVLSPSAGLTVALYTMTTYVVEHLAICALLIIRSAMKRSGKTTLLDILSRMVKRALSASSISAAAFYRVVEAVHPTLLIDETDAIFAQKNDIAEALRGLLNAGHTRTSSTVYRCEGESLEVVGFDCFGPKILAGIGRRADTLEDRAIAIDMRRKLESEKVARFSALEDDEEYAALRSRLTRWAADHAEEIGRARPKIPEDLNDRAADNWTPLLAVADLARGEFPTIARVAAMELSGPATEEEQDYKVQLLQDLLTLFDEKIVHIPTAMILIELNAMEESPWATINRGRKPLDARKLASLLKPFGVKSRNIKQPDGSVPKGYSRVSFIDPWVRYIRYSATAFDKSLQDKEKNSSAEGSGSAADPLLPGIQKVADVSATATSAATNANGQKGLFYGENQGISSDGSGVAEEREGAKEKNSLTIPSDLSAFTLEQLRAMALQLVEIIDGKDGSPARPDLMPELTRIEAAMADLEGDIR